MNSTRRDGFTMIELLVVMSILAVLAAILFPVFAGAREKARGATCMSNLRQIGIALESYSQDYDESLPYHMMCLDEQGTYQNWLGTLSPYSRSTGIYNCPSNPDGKYTGPDAVALSYVYNRDLNGACLASVSDTAGVISALDGLQVSCSFAGGDTFRDTDGMAYSEDPNSGEGAHETIFARHNGGGNCLFLDGHTKWLRSQHVQEYLEVR